MLGPMLAVSVAALAGVNVKMPKLALSSILIILGLHIGNYKDQNLINQMKEWIWTSAIMFVYILLSIFIVSKYLQKYSGYKEKTSIFSAAPGALGPLLILAEYEKSDLSQVATSHLIRLIIIITVFPFFVVNFSTTEAIEVVKFSYIDQNQSIYSFQGASIPIKTSIMNLITLSITDVKDKICLDIGANIGTHSVILSGLFSKVYSVNSFNLILTFIYLFTIY